MKKFLTISLLVLMLGVGACQPRITDDKIPQIVSTVESTTESAVYLALAILEKESPEAVAQIELDLLFLESELRILVTTGADVSTISSVILKTVERINDRLELIDNENTQVYLTALVIALEGANDYYETYEFPSDVKAIALAISQGIIDGVETYHKGGE